MEYNSLHIHILGKNIEQNECWTESIKSTKKRD